MAIKVKSGFSAIKENASSLGAMLFIGTKSAFAKNNFSVSIKGTPLEEVFNKHLQGLEAKPEAGLYNWSSLVKSEAAIGFLLLEDKTKTLDLLESLRSAFATVVLQKNTFVRFIISDDLNASDTSKALGIALSARILPMPKYGKVAKEQKPFLLSEVQLISAQNSVERFNEGLILGEGSHLVRKLGMTPANYLNPKIYGEEIKKLCASNKLTVKFHSNKALKKMGAGAFTAVDQGDPNSFGGVYEITYKPTKAKNKSPVALVGKGLCFDTGGYNIKTGNYMLTMKGDMQGSAVALSTLICASRLKWPLHLKAWLAVTENHISPKAFKPDDLVTALNGKTIEVIDTDAEGRMVLADTLTLATKEKPMFCLDFATLTGAAVRAVGSRMGVGFSNDESLHRLIKECGVASGERVWPFPLEEDYGTALESKVADIMQCSPSPGPDHIWAAYFLSKFIENKTPWVHIDLSASENDSGLGAANGPFTGFGVLWATEFIKRKFL